MSKSFGGSKQTQTNTNQQTNALNSQSSNWLQQIFDAAKAAGMGGPSGLLTGASGFGTGAQTAGNLGLSALSGNAAAMGQLMSPYQQNVIDAMNKQFGVQNQQTMNQVNDAATRAGAFGGDRAAVAQGTALAQNQLNQGQQIANLLNSGYENAQGVAGNLANAGFSGAGLNANLGMQGVGSPQQWLLQMLRQGFLMPTGSGTYGSSGSSNSNLGYGFKIG